MFSEFRDQKHRAQAETFLLALGRFVLAFERVCAAMRILVMLVLRKGGLANQPMAQVIISKPQAKELRDLLGALLLELRDLDEDDRTAITELIRRVEKLTEERNRLVHSDWHLGVEPAETELTAASYRFKATPSRGACFEELCRCASEIEQQTLEAKSCQVLLQRVSYCVNQAGFKIATELRKTL